MRWIDRLRLRLRTLFVRSVVEDELHREIRFHLEEEMAANIAAGMPAEEARYAAMRTLGGTAQIQEQCREQRGLQFVETTAQDLRYAIRSVKKNPAFTAVAVISLALGVGANAAIFSLLNSVLLSSLAIPDPQQLVFVRTNQTKVGNFQVSHTISLSDLRAMSAAEGLDGMAGYQSEDRLNLGVDGQAELASGQFVSGDYFRALRVKPALGRTLTLSDNSLQHSDSEWPAMISYGFWQRRFAADPAVIGKRVTVNTVPFLLVGVLPAGFDSLSIDQRTDLTLPMLASAEVRAGSLSEGPAKDQEPAGMIFARLRGDGSRSKVAAQLTVLFRNAELSRADTTQQGRDSVQHRYIEFEPAAKGSSFLRERFAKPLLVIMAVVTAVMIIACANIATLLLARGSARRKEVAVRLSLGASRARLMRQMLTESLVISALGCGVGALFALIAHSATLEMGIGSSPARRDISFHWDVRVVAFLAVVCVVNTVLFGLLPALRATAVDPHESLKAGTSSSSRLPFGRLLVAGQLAVSLALVIAAGLFLATVRNLFRVDWGFEPAKLLTVTLDPKMIGYDGRGVSSFYERLLDEARTLPSVKSATLINNPLFSGRAYLSPWNVPGYTPKPGETNFWTVSYEVGPRFCSTLQMPIVAGRDFDDQDTEKSPLVVVVNAAFAKHYFGDRFAVGEHLTLTGRNKTATIVGVAANGHYFDAEDEQQEVVFSPLAQVETEDRNSEETLILRTQGEPYQVVPELRALITRLAPNLPVVNVTTMTERLEQDLSQQRLMAVLSSFFGAVALGLSAIGLYGLLAYAVSKRTGEIGIRMALGADRGNIFRLVMSETGLLIGTGAGIGIVLAFVTTRVIKSMLFGVSTHDLRVYALGCALMILMTCLSALLPARRAVSVDPNVALRYE